MKDYALGILNIFLFDFYVSFLATTRKEKCANINFIALLIY